MSAFPSLPLFTREFKADTEHLTAQETGAYLLLLMKAWETPGCYLPDDDRRLSIWARVDAKTWRAIRPTVLEFWELGEDRCWRQKRLTKEFAYVAQRAAISRANGQRGGRKPSSNPAGSSRVRSRKAPTPTPTPNPKGTPNGVPGLSNGEALGKTYSNPKVGVPGGGMRGDGRDG